MLFVEDVRDQLDEYGQQLSAAHFDVSKHFASVSKKLRDLQQDHPRVLMKDVYIDDATFFSLLSRIESLWKILEERCDHLAKYNIQLMRPPNLFEILHVASQHTRSTETAVITAANALEYAQDVAEVFHHALSKAEHKRLLMPLQMMLYSQHRLMGESATKQFLAYLTMQRIHEVTLLTMEEAIEAGELSAEEIDHTTAVMEKTQTHYQTLGKDTGLADFELRKLKLVGGMAVLRIGTGARQRIIDEYFKPKL